MILFTLLLIMSVFILLVAGGILTIGGGLFIIVFADIIVAMGIIWFIFLRKKNKTK